MENKNKNANKKIKTDKNRKATDCESCVNFVYDEEADLYECLVNLDEDEMVRFMTQSDYCCPYYRLDDEYGTVRKQM